jgi:alpha,alpha-trehalose phosphorylase
MVIPWDGARGVHPQSEGFTDHQHWDFTETRPDQYPLLLHFPYFDLYRKQVVKQADLVLALHWCGDAFTDEQKAKDFAYYEALTVRDSSLSASTQAVVAAEVGQLELAYDYFGEAALMDLHDIEHNTRDGLHIASLAGAWLTAVAGFGGMRDYNGRLTFAPRLPSQLQRLAFGLRFQGRRIRIEATREHATYRLLDGAPLELQHHGTSVTITTERPSTQRIPRATAAPATRPPLGREPTRRQTGTDGSTFAPIGNNIGDSPLGADAKTREQRAA